MFYVVLTLSDPSDRAVQESQGSNSLSAIEQHEESSLILCTLCKGRVGKGSVHCAVCNRCVNGYKMHFRWVNNCIGSKNVGFFWCFLVTLLVSEMNLTAFLIYFLSISQSSEFQDKSSSYLHWDSSSLILSLYVLDLVTSVALFLCLLRLSLRYFCHTYLTVNHPAARYESNADRSGNVEDLIHPGHIDVSMATRSQRRSRLVLPSDENNTRLSQLRALAAAQDDQKIE